MPTDYDRIATEYQESKHQPWRRHVECFTLCQLLGDLSGRSALDLACGEGFYSRILRRKGAARVVGVDSSARMIELAREQEARSPLGVEYLVGDARGLDLADRFDVVVAAYLLNHARTADELLQMCQAAARHLRPGGSFVGVNNNPDQPRESFASSRPYGFVKSTPGELREGAPITYTLFVDGGGFDITNYHLSTATHEWALRSAGFRETRWHRPRLSAEGAVAFPEGYWAALLDDAPVIFIESVKGP